MKLIKNIKETIIPIEKCLCYCVCHKYPRVYKCEPCSYCGHYNNEGNLIGGLTNGWRKRKNNL